MTDRPIFQCPSPDPYLAELCRQLVPELEPIKPFRQIHEETQQEARAIVKGEKE